jgi:hypothetical protein
MKIPHPKFPKFVGKINRNPKRLIIIAVVVVLVAGIVTFSAFSCLNWRDLSDRSNQAPITLKSLIDTSLGNSDSKNAVKGQIDTIIKDFNKMYGVNPCVSPAQFQWQTVVPALKDIQNTCNSTFSDSLAVIDSLKNLSAFIDLEQNSAKSVKTAIESTVKSTDYTASAKVWSDLAASSSANSNNKFQSVSDKIKSAATDIATAYTALSTALTAQDKSGLDTAISGLQSKYDELVSINNTATVEKTKLTDRLMGQYKTL